MKNNLINNKNKHDHTYTKGLYERLVTVHSQNVVLQNVCLDYIISLQ